MSDDLKMLIDEVIEVTGATPPAIFDAESPVLEAGTDARDFYIVGLVGGKDVGKSTLVNALVGQPISAATSHGPGTESVIAYAHQSVAERLRALLQNQVPGRFAIVTHSHDRVARQVLLDLPDIDSHWGDHVQITRRMLRHMLYPLWIQSVEKYADRRPQDLLSAVAEGNDPANFIFCLNKADQLDPAAAQELRGDYASRVARAIQLPSPPSVYLISATHPDQFDLQALAAVLSRQKSDDAIKTSFGMARQRQDRALFGWIGHQRLNERAEQLARLERDAGEITATRIAVPLLNTAIPGMLDDPGRRAELVWPAASIRLSRWPVVNAIDALLWPLLALVQKNLSASAGGSADPDAYLDGSSVSSNVQAAFAQLHQLQPQLGEIYQHRKLWESLHADASAIDLRRRFATVSERQQQAILQTASSRFSILFAPVRWLLTIGALLWFPFVQPVLSIMLQQDSWALSRKALLVLVDVLSVSHFLQCTTFLLLWFFILWLLLRFSAQRRVNRILQRWKSADLDDELSLAGQALHWIDEMIEPIRTRRRRIDELIQRVEELRRQLGVLSPAPAPGELEPSLA